MPKKKQASKQISVTIGTPHNGDFTAEYINSLLGMAFHAFVSKGVQIKLHLHEGCYVHQGRNNIASKCFSDYLLFVDSDMAFPVDGLNKLIEADKDIIGGLYYSRKAPNLPHVFNYDEAGKLNIFEDCPQDEIFECDAIATGFMLIKKSVLDAFDEHLKKEPSDLPFNFKHVNGVELGEDMAFCYRAKQLGFKIFCDPTIALGHVAKDVITRNNYLAWK